MRQVIDPNTDRMRLAVTADAEMQDKDWSVDIHKQVKSSKIKLLNDGLVLPKRSTVVSSTQEQKLDITDWLPFAAKKYEISGDIQDYIFVPVLTIPSDLPNRNGVAFPLKTLVEFNVQQGCQGYKTFRGKPVHYEHNNKNPLEAKGVIADAFLKPLEGFGGKKKIWKVMLLLAIDRTKDVDLSMKIDKGDMNSYSMGAYVDSYSCSYCGAELGKCRHIPLKSPVCFQELNKKLVFKNMHGMEGFECSSVATPAWSPAASDIIMR